MFVPRAFDGVSWVRVQAGRAWDGALLALREYHQANGNADVPKRYVTPAGYRLGHWLSRQRSQHNAGTLPPDRVKALEQLGVNWAPPSGWIAARTDR